MIPTVEIADYKGKVLYSTKGKKKRSKLLLKLAYLVIKNCGLICRFFVTSGGETRELYYLQTLQYLKKHI